MGLLEFYYNHNQTLKGSYAVEFVSFYMQRQSLSLQYTTNYMNTYDVSS